MPLSLERSIGAVADVRELEYCAALHQTCEPSTRANGTISSVDVQWFLLSRYGVQISHTTARSLVQGLAGGKRLATKKEPTAKHHRTQFEEMLDLVQFVSIVLIPTIARAGEEWRQSVQPQFFDVYGHETGPPGLYQRSKDALTKLLQNRREAEYKSLCPQPEGLIRKVWTMLMVRLAEEGSNWNSGRCMQVNSQFVRSLLLAYGEEQRANDTELVEAMVQVASSPSGNFDVEAFASALTSDLTDWEVGCEDRLSTTFHDVFGFDNVGQERRRRELEQQNKHREEADVERGKRRDPEEGIQLDHDVFFGGHGSDFVIDDHSSLVSVVMVWVFFLCQAFIYTSIIQVSPHLESSCESQLGSSNEMVCILASTVWTWLLLAVILVVSGLLFVPPLSYGNSPSHRSFRSYIYSFLFAAIFTILPFWVIKYIYDNAEPPYSEIESLVRNNNFRRVQMFAAVSGAVLCCLYLFQAVKLSLFDRLLGRGWEMVDWWIATSDVRGAARLKRAATRKINVLLRNATDLHTVPTQIGLTSSTRAGRVHQASLNYIMRGEQSESAGGFFWTWRRVLSGRLFDTEGVWIHSRLVIIQMSQIVCAVLAFVFLWYSIEIMGENAQQTRDELNPAFPQWVHDLVPTKTQVYHSLYPALGVTTLAMVALIGIYLPSTVGIILQYRCGKLRSLGSKEFILYRTKTESVYYNIGNAVYGMIGSAALFFVLIGGVLFLFFWSYSQKFMLRLLGWGIGLSITTGLKMLLTHMCRTRYFRSFYRSNRRGAILSTLALETWFIGLGGGVLVGRLTQFLLAAAFWIGRIDSPFLAESVSIFGYAFDYVPSHFVKEILTHEAHRHPFLERLCGMYLMKLKNKSFCNDAGCCWRQLFVLALMPWLVKHRVFSEEIMAPPVSTTDDIEFESDMDDQFSVDGSFYSAVEMNNETLKRFHE